MFLDESAKKLANFTPARLRLFKNSVDEVLDKLLHGRWVEVSAHSFDGILGMKRVINQHLVLFKKRYRMEIFYLHTSPKILGSFFIKLGGGEVTLTYLT